MPGSNPACVGFFFRGQVIPVTYKLALQCLPCQGPGGIGSLLGLVDPVSVYCDWVRWKVGSATSVSVRQHVKLSEQIRPWDTLACCWDVKQPTNQQTLLCYVTSSPSTWSVQPVSAVTTWRQALSRTATRAPIFEPWLLHRDWNHDLPHSRCTP